MALWRALNLRITASEHTPQTTQRKATHLRLCRRVRHGFRIFPSQSLHLRAQSVRAPPSGIPEGQRQGGTPFWREGGGGSCPGPGTTHRGPVVTSGAGTKPCPWGLRLTGTLGVGSSTAQSMALPSLHPCAWPLQAGLAHRGKCTRHSHGAAHTHSGTLLYLSPCPLKSQNQAVSEEVRPPPHSH